MAVAIHTLSTQAGSAVTTLIADPSSTASISLSESGGVSSEVSITSGNLAPVLDVASSASIAENSPTSTVVFSATATDADSNALTFSLSGVDASYFSIDAQTGAVKLLSSANYEAKASYSVTVKATDSLGAFDSQNVVVAVTNVAERLSGTIVDGYIAGATIFQDANNNDVLDEGEPSTTTSVVGDFTLEDVLSSPDAPIKMISGFDIGTNNPIVTTIGAPSTSADYIVASPLSTIISLALANDQLEESSVFVSRLGTYLGLSDVTLEKINLLTDNPIELLRDSDSSIVSAAKNVFAANQFVMSQANITGSFTKYVAQQFEIQAQTYLTSLGLTNQDVLGTTDSYEKIGSDAIFEKIADAIATTINQSGETLYTNLATPDFAASVVNHAEENLVIAIPKSKSSTSVAILLRAILTIRIFCIRLGGAGFS
jgi:hypothetical protein